MATAIIILPTKAIRKKINNLGVIILEIYDLHTHILPQLDDGAANASETLTLIKMLKEQGVCGVAATPHFSARRSVEDALLLRCNAQKKVEHYFEANDIKLISGFEVRCFLGISRLPDIRKLTYGDSDYILLELPYNEPISMKMLEEIVSLNMSMGLKPIMAHIERYSKLKGFGDLISLISDGYAEAHINAPSINNIFMRKSVLELTEGRAATLIASDTHSIKKRPPEWDKALKVMDKKMGRSLKFKLLSRSEEIFHEVYNA